MAENLKQIIIDGVDVSGCEFLRNCIIPDNYGCKIDDSLCCDVGNCYYKQLKRKEQECEGLGQAYLETNELLQEKTKECTNLKAENKELEEENKKLKEELLDLKLQFEEEQLMYEI